MCIDIHDVVDGINGVVAVDDDIEDDVVTLVDEHIFAAATANNDIGEGINNDDKDDNNDCSDIDGDVAAVDDDDDDVDDEEHNDYSKDHNEKDH